MKEDLLPKAGDLAPVGTIKMIMSMIYIEKMRSDRFVECAIWLFAAMGLTVTFLTVMTSVSSTKQPASKNSHTCAHSV